LHSSPSLLLFLIGILFINVGSLITRFWFSEGKWSKIEKLAKSSFWFHNHFLGEWYLPWNELINSLLLWVMFNGFCNLHLFNAPILRSTTNDSLLDTRRDLWIITNRLLVSYFSTGHVIIGYWKFIDFSWFNFRYLKP
jgi:hypothetical protein